MVVRFGPLDLIEEEILPIGSLKELVERNIKKGIALYKIIRSLKSTLPCPKNHSWGAMDHHLHNFITSPCPKAHAWRVVDRQSIPMDMNAL